MESDILEQCYQLQCNSKNQSGTIIDMYRSHVLRTCEVDDSIWVSGYHSPHKILYLRHKLYIPYDAAVKFHHIILNADHMIAELSTSF